MMESLMDVGLNAPAVMLVALASATSRAGLNLIDRVQLGRLGLSVFNVNFWNNVVPAVAMALAITLLGWHHALLASLIDVRTALFSGLVQLVAYAYSHSFRKFTVTEVTVAGKAADLFIPIGLLASIGYWDWVTYGFSVVTTLICLPLLQSVNQTRTASIRPAVLVIGSALVLQATLSPLLAPSQGSPSTKQALLFATAVVVWRVMWSALPLIRGVRRRCHSLPLNLLSSPLFIARVVLSVLTQITFILAISSQSAAVAWPILNATGVLAMVLSSLVLKETPSRLQTAIVTALGGLAVVRYLTL